MTVPWSRILQQLGGDLPRSRRSAPDTPYQAANPQPVPHMPVPWLALEDRRPGEDRLTETGLSLRGPALTPAAAAPVIYSRAWERGAADTAGRSTWRRNAMATALSALVIGFAAREIGVFSVESSPSAPLSDASIASISPDAGEGRIRLVSANPDDGINLFHPADEAAGAPRLTAAPGKQDLGPLPQHSVSLDAEIETAVERLGTQTSSAQPEPESPPPAGEAVLDEEILMAMRLLEAQEAAQEQEPQTPPPASGPSEEEVAACLKRGRALMSRGDVAAARLLYEHLALRGSAVGALEMARSYDPDVLNKMYIQGLQPDIAQARYWYRKAVELGDAQGQDPLDQLAER